MTEPIEHELIRSIACVDIKVVKTEKQPTSADDWHLVIEGRLGEAEDDDVEFAGMGLLYSLGLLSFADARPRGVSEMDFDATDHWTSGDMLRHFRFESGELHFSADYVRGRCMKTDVIVRRDGTFRLETTHRGEAATRWIARLQGKKVLAPVRGLPAGTGPQ
ncbi:MAG TPA: hypothetical protein VFZ09_07555 [Archangium sp.]|uniref:hypothetical protein n=1 Tax=Archangium sp. TaxID=1872627 RepID=UPI002E37295C|nr:hypothetical protein [Archangium sp.]HEX5746083.1 hypothetical protein [Archangium sp.]